MIPTLNTVVVVLVLVLVLVPAVVPAVVPYCAPQTHFFEEDLPLVFSMNSKRHHSFPSAFRILMNTSFPAKNAAAPQRKVSIHKPWQETTPKQLFKMLPHEPPKY